MPICTAFSAEELHPSLGCLIQLLSTCKERHWLQRMLQHGKRWQQIHKLKKDQEERARTERVKRSRAAASLKQIERNDNSSPSIL